MRRLPLGFALLLACLLAVPFASASDGSRELEELDEAGRIYHGELAEYVKAVGARVVAGAGLDPDDYHFNVVDRARVNAYAMGGGYIFVDRGILPYLKTEDQLAAVLGHELGHLTADHPGERKRAAAGAGIGSFILGVFTRSRTLVETAQGYAAALISGYGREQELEADRLGARYLTSAGYDPIAMLEVIRVLKDQELYRSEVEGQGSSYHGLFASHPRNDRRLYEVIQAGSASAEPPAGYVERLADYLDEVEGLPWGTVAADGLIKGSRYYHGGFGFVLDFPEDWRVADSPSVISATPPHGSSTVVTVERTALGEEVEPVRFIEDRLELDLEDGRQIEVDGLPGYMGVVAPETAAEEEVEADGEGDGGETEAAAEKPAEGAEEPAVLRLVAVVLMDGGAYILKGENSEPGFDGSFVEGFSRTVASFRRMRRSDLEEATTLRVETVVARPEDTYEALARAHDMGRDGAQRLRLLNGDYPRGQPRAGDRIKIIR